MAWVRTCQECGYKQYVKKSPKDYKGESWRELKCKKCGSPALDYGHEPGDDPKLKYDLQQGDTLGDLDYEF